MQKRTYCGLVGVMVLVLAGYQLEWNSAQAQPATAAPTASGSEDIERLLQEADALFQRQALLESYNLYLRVLGVEPLNQRAWDKTYTIVTVYQRLTDEALQADNADQAKLSRQTYQGMLRDVLQILMTQLKREIQRYAELGAVEKTGQVVAPEMVTTLQNILQLLRHLHTIYVKFPTDDAGSTGMSERIAQTIDKYEQELRRYELVPK